MLISTVTGLSHYFTPWQFIFNPLFFLVSSTNASISKFIAATYITISGGGTRFEKFPTRVCLDWVT